MTVGTRIREMIEDAMLSAYIVSPRFDDYEIASVEIPDRGLENALDQEIEILVEGAPAGNTSNAQLDAHVKSYGKHKAQESLKELGIRHSKKALNFLQGPKEAVIGEITNYFKDFARSLPLVGPLVVAALGLPQVAKKLTEIMARRGGPIDVTFRRHATTMANELRTVNSQQEIRSGFTQVIFSSRAGTPYERDTYNSYVQKDSNQQEFESSWEIRDLSGVYVP